MADDLVVIGRVTRPHGVRGEMRILPFTESQASFERFDRVYVQPQGRAPGLATVEKFRPAPKVVLMKIEGVRTREEAARLTGADILVRREWLPDLEEDEYYWVDLIGLQVVDEQDNPWGQVRNIMNTGSDDIVVLDNGGKELLIPFRAEVVLKVDLPEKRLVIRPPEGLFDD